MSCQLEYPNEPIAIIGSACKFPGQSSSPSKLWDLLRQPRDVLSQIPKSRFNAEKFYHPNGLHHGTSNVRHGYVLSEDIRTFDARFFELSPVEANAIDPQQRLLLETAYEALESAGISLTKIRGSSTGVFVGMMSEEYSTIMGRDMNDIPIHFATGTSRSIASNRISYYFDLHGPSITLDTACSSSLVAIHQAVTSLRSGESSCAIVGGSNLLLGPEQFITESKLRMLSPNGRSRMWDKGADGYARGEGIGVLVLKTLSQALLDHDSVECVIRETGVNQDGRTNGITMPNASAQMNLIRKTYERAGLDPTRPQDRPQYFEAHGTGTVVGDSIEAEAISRSFFPVKSEDSTLYVGSIKTIIGHLEGAAGIAGIMRASLALQHGTIPPNLLLEQLSPKIEPFYSHLKIIKEPRGWPNIETQSIRRASVNSFGFGGTNAHAILENFVPDQPIPIDREDPSQPDFNTLPFNFSAASKQSLISTLTAYASYLKDNPMINLRDLAWTLNERRSTLPIRVSISASTRNLLIEKLEKAAMNLSNNEIHGQPTSTATSNRILGIFTGQGAQWPTMGKQLLQTSKLVENCLEQLQESLDSLPADHAPAWKLKAELLKSDDISRVGQSEISQPICTAVQIALIDLLRSVNVHFTDVIGHSSGEIAAAYASGYISAKDAIRIAYYRGLYSNLAGSLTGKEGRMIAAGTTLEDAEHLCSLPSMVGRISVAATNSPSSVTLSGDIDAVQDALEIFEDEKKFARMLKVDKAYHSHHMKSCTPLYVEALEACNIDVHFPTPSHPHPTWISTVEGRPIRDSDLDRLKSVYWAENLTNQVKFSQAVEYYLGHHEPLIAIEVGPHPVLKGPALETARDVLGHPVPYVGTLVRGLGDTEAFANTLGTIWTVLGEGFVKFSALDSTIFGTDNRPKLLKNLPSYSWSHDRVYWHETRHGKAIRTAGGKPHPLLGTICPDQTENEYRFKNFLDPRELPWLSHHQMQGQIVFPLAGYISAVIEAIVRLYAAEPIQLFELTDMVVGKALFISESSGTETLLSIRMVEDSTGYIDATFSFFSDGKGESTTMVKNASGKLRITRGERDDDVLPAPHQLSPQFLSLDVEDFYTSISNLGYGYYGDFRGMSDISRKGNEAAGFISTPDTTQDDEIIILHPAILDCAIQSVLLAYSYPGDGQLRSLHLPTKIDHISIALPSYQHHARKPNTKLPFYACVPPGQVAELSGDVDIHSPDGEMVLVQVQGVHVTPLKQPSLDDDLFFEMVWCAENPTGSAIDRSLEETKELIDISCLADEISSIYLRRLATEFPPDRRNGLSWHYTRLLDYADQSTATIPEGTLRETQDQRAKNEEDRIIDSLKQYPESMDLKVIRDVGESLILAIRRGKDVEDIMPSGIILSEFLAHSLGMQEYLDEVVNVVSQLVHRFPRMRILEIGTGIISFTRSLLESIGSAFASYTYVDTSDIATRKAHETFSELQPEADFNIVHSTDSDAIRQLDQGSYDLVITSAAVHATPEWGLALNRLRELMDPGGYMVMLEPTDAIPARLGLILGCMPSWLPGRDLLLSPGVYVNRWKDLIHETEFSEVEIIKPHYSQLSIPFSIMICQAINERVKLLRQPLAMTDWPPGQLGSLSIVGAGDTPKELLISVSNHYRDVRRLSSLEDVASITVPLGGTAVILVDLEEPSAFEIMTGPALRAIQHIYQQSRIVVWVTSGSPSSNPYKNMFRGFHRSVALEMADVCSQIIDFATPGLIDTDLIATRLLQSELTYTWYGTSQPNDILWHTEPEICVRDGKVMIPRMRLSPERNRRYNSARKTVTRDVHVQESQLCVGFSGSHLSIEEATPTNTRTDDLEAIRLLHSLVNPVRTRDTFAAFISIGERIKTGGRVIVLSNSLDSRVYVPETWTLKAPECPKQALQVLFTFHAHLVAYRILDRATTSQSIAVLNVDYSIGETVARLARQRGLRLSLITTEKERHGQPWVYIHPRSTSMSIRKVLPKDLSMVIDMDSHNSISSSLRRCLPAECVVLDESNIFGDHARCDASEMGQLADYIQEPWLQSSTSSSASIGTTGIPQFDLRSLSDAKIDPALGSGQAMLNWNAYDTIPIPVQPASKQVRFAPDKTYWLAGLTGGLGLSLAQWMLDRGAKYIALSSRNPNIDDRWLESMAAQGCTVKVFANDITDRQSVMSMYSTLTKTMPPVAGVAQGAMVMHDASFSSLNIDDMRRVLRPKVDGSIHLDEIFSENTLDFFVFFSSLAYDAGNRGQSVYGAANAFMAGLAANRRSRGLAGSVINVGVIVGEGYVSRRLKRQQQLNLYHSGFSPISERVFHEIFAEGVIVSHPDSPGTWELSAGLRLAEHEHESGMKTWASNPIFQHLVARTRNQNVRAGNSQGRISMKDRLLGVQSHEQMLDVVADCLAEKLQLILHTDLEKREIFQSSPLELGIDSLVAVDIQSWFRKTLSIDVSILEILNAPSLTALLGSIDHLLFLDMVPRLEISEVADIPYSVTGDISGSSTGKLSTPSLRSEITSAATSEVASVDGSDQLEPMTLTSLSQEAINPKIVETRPMALQRSARMSYAQSRFWFLRHLVDSQVAFNVTTSIHLEGTINHKKLEAALITVGKRHEALRTIFYTDPESGQHMQGIMKDPTLGIEHVAITDEAQVNDSIRELQNHVFDISNGESMRLKLLSLSDQSHVLLVGYHHIFLDGIGLHVFLSDLERAYLGTLAISDPTILQYPDFAEREYREHQDGHWSKQLEFWRRELKDPPSPLPMLAMSHKLAWPTTPVFDSWSTKFQIHSELKTKINQFCSRVASTPFHLHLAVFYILIFRYTNNSAKDICIGVGDGNRKDVDVLRSLGLFLNLLPLRFKCDTDWVFADLLKSVKSVSDNAFSDSRVPFNVILDTIGVSRESSRSPLFQAFLNYRPRIQDTRNFCGCDAHGELISGGQNAYDISIDITDSNTGEDGIVLSLNKGVYSQGDVDMLAKSYISLLKYFVRNSEATIIQPSIYVEEDIQKAIDSGRGPELLPSWPPTIVHRIDDMVDAYGSNIALKDGLGNMLTYDQMNRRICQLALKLEKRGVGHGSIVGVCQLPSADWVCSFLAVLRVGATCIALDLDVGWQRLLVIANDCKPSVLMVGRKKDIDRDFLAQVQAEILDVSQVAGCEDAYTVHNAARASDTAAIVYTSGSTGVPNGILVKHESYRNFVEFAPPRWGFEEGRETVLQQSSYAFDMSIGQILVCLSYGGTLIIPESSKRRDPMAICEMIISERVTFTLGTPTEYLGWIRANGEKLRTSQWRGTMSGGELMSDSLIQAFKSLGKSSLRLFNSYGPAEGTFGCADCPILYSEDDALASGMISIPNSSICIVDEDLNPVPTGIPGQVVIGGAGIARGYLNQHELTTRAFLNDRHATSFLKAQGWTTAFLSGDRGRLDANGGLIIQSRIAGSTQIKLGGVRMDLGDIESTIVQSMAPFISQAVVSLRTDADSGLQFLVAFVVIADAELPVDRAEFVAQLPHKLPLPQYMRPSIAVLMEEMPKTASNKVDRVAINSLPLPNHSSSGVTGVDDSLSEMENALWVLWEMVLPTAPRRRISRTSDFFHAGGNSLALIKLQNLIREHFSIEITLFRLFEAISLDKMAKALEDELDPESERVEWEEEVRISPDLSDGLPTEYLDAPTGPPSSIAITGATGFLGMELLRQLAGNPDISSIHCIAVRKPLERLPEIFSHWKVTVHPGDLGDKQLGLSDEDTKTIFGEIGAVIHVGADVSFLKTYKSLKLTNVASTKELVRLALPRRIPFHFVSSATVARLTGQESFGPASVSPYPPRGKTVDGYTASKWVSEVYLEAIGKEFGLPVVIHRPSSVTGDNAPESDLMSSVIKYARKTNTYPQSSAWGGYINFISVEEACKTILSSVFENVVDASRVQYIYESGEVEIEANDIQSWIANDAGKGETLPVHEWIEVAVEAGMNPLLAMYLRHATSERVFFPRLIKG